MKRVILSLFAALSLVFTPLLTHAAADDLQPYVLASSSAGTVDGKVAEVKSALAGAGFEVVGDYRPYAGAAVVVVTSDDLKKTAGMTEHGGFGAAVRVGVTELDGKVQASYTNPAYWAAAYRMKGSLDSVSAAMRKALGAESTFGYSKGFSSDDLRGYHYMMMMPYFDDADELGSFASQTAAVSAVEANLKAGKAGTGMVYRVDLPGGKATLFGVSFATGTPADKDVMGIVDGGKMRHTAHLPYEVLVEGGKVYALHGKFRIAIAFPELTMGTFMKISGVPGAITETLQAIAK